MTTASRTPPLARAVIAAGAAALVLGIPTVAQAHVTADAADTTAGAHTVLTLSVPHGCDGSATTEVAVEIPDEITAVTPTRHAFYDVRTLSEDLPEPRTSADGATITERAARVVYTAKTPLPDDQRDAFELSLQLPEDAAGKTLSFPTVQTCEDGKTSWTEIPAEGQSSDDLEHPAPSITVSAQDDADASDAAGSATSAGSEDMAEHPSHGPSTGLVITSLVIGALGLVTGAAALITARRRP